MRWVIAIGAGILGGAFGIAALVQAWRALGQAFHGHPFSASGNLILFVIYAFVVWLCIAGARAALTDDE